MAQAASCSRLDPGGLSRFYALTPLFCFQVTSPRDHFGPIPAEFDPERKKGVLVGEYWSDRLECRQWGAHLPHVAGIAGQAKVGAQSVALSGGYEVRPLGSLSLF